MPSPIYLQQQLQMRQLRLLSALAEHGSLSAAARALRLTQPATTKGLQELERLAQIKLFERLPKGVRPTAAGNAFIAFAERTLAELDRLSEAVGRGVDDDGGIVVLGALPVTAAGLLPLMVRTLRREHPLLELRLVVERTDAAVSKLIAGELDLVLGRLYPPELPDGLERQVIYDEPLAIIARAGHPLLSQGRQISAPDLGACDILLPTFGQKLGREIEHLVTQLGLRPSPRLMRSTSNVLIRELLLGSDAVAVSPRMLMAGDLMRGALQVLPLELKAPARPAGLITSPDRPLGPGAERVIAAARTAVRELAANPNAITSAHG